jgi:hypothetical protein
MNLKQMNQRHRQVHDSEGSERKLLAELPARRFVIETGDGLHRIYDTQPVDGEKNPLDECSGPLGEQIQRDRAIVADARAPEAARLRALSRILNRR